MGGRVAPGQVLLRTQLDGCVTLRQSLIPGHWATWLLAGVLYS